MSVSTDGFQRSSRVNDWQVFKVQIPVCLDCYKPTPRKLSATDGMEAKEGENGRGTGGFLPTYAFNTVPSLRSGGLGNNKK